MNSPQIIFLVGAFALSLLIGCHTSKEKADLIVEQEPVQVHPSLQMLPVQGGLGVNIHFYKGNEKDLLMLSEANVGLVRMDVSWGGVEKSPGEYVDRRFRINSSLQYSNFEISEIPTI